MRIIDKLQMPPSFPSKSSAPMVQGNLISLFLLLFSGGRFIPGVIYFYLSRCSAKKRVENSTWKQVQSLKKVMSIVQITIKHTSRLGFFRLFMPSKPLNKLLSYWLSWMWKNQEKNMGKRQKCFCWVKV